PRSNKPIIKFKANSKAEPDRNNSSNLAKRTMSDKNTLSPVTRRQAFATVAIGVSLMAKPAILRAQTPLTVNFVQQRGLLYLPVDEMVSGGILQQEAA